MAEHDGLVKACWLRDEGAFHVQEFPKRLVSPVVLVVGVDACMHINVRIIL
ncbi:hypothetical protein D3C84_1137710 [compost metagenome]